MRQKIETQCGMFCQYSDHKFSEELQKISAILDSMPNVLDLATLDLEVGINDTGARGTAVESVVRAAIIQKINRLTYRELEFQIADSLATKAFLRLKDGATYKHSALQNVISRISSETWECINQEIIQYAVVNKIENCKTVRVDSTVVDSNIHHPTDSSLLYDCMRVISRLYFQIANILGSDKLSKLKFTSKKAKNLVISILNSKNDEMRLPFYTELITGCGEVFFKIPKLLELMPQIFAINEKKYEKINDELLNIQGLMSGVIAQTIARVIDGESVAAEDKIVSIFEDHTDVIVKGRRETEFGHKLFLTTGKSNLVLDCMIPDGNPSDVSLFMPLVNRLKDFLGRAPQKIAADGGFASTDNVKDAKKAGIKDISFSKRCGLAISDMARSEWVYDNLKRFRAGIESNISALKRGFCLSRAMWKGINGFKSYVWSGIVSYNLSLLATAK